MAFQARRRFRLASTYELAMEIEPSEAGNDFGRPIRVSGESAPVGEEPLQAAISQKQCVYWKYEVLERVRRVGKSTTTRTVEEGKSNSAFVIRDSGGQIIVDPTQVQIRDIVASAIRADLPSGFGLGGLSLGAVKFNLGFGRNRYANEWKIPLGATVYAVGELQHGEAGAVHLVPGQAVAAVTTLPFSQFIRKQRLWGFVMVGGAIAGIVGGIYLLMQGL